VKTSSPSYYVGFGMSGLHMVSPLWFKAQTNRLFQLKQVVYFSSDRPSVSGQTGRLFQLKQAACLNSKKSSASAQTNRLFQYFYRMVLVYLMCDYAAVSSVNDPCLIYPSFMYFLCVANCSHHPERCHTEQHLRRQGKTF